MRDTEIHRGYTLKPTETGGLGYSNEFRQLLRRRPGVVKAAINLAQRAEDAYTPGEMQVGLYTFSWNKGDNNWEAVAYQGHGLEIPKPLGHTIWGRGALMKPDQPLAEPDLGLEVTVLGKATRELGSTLFDLAPTRLDVSTYLRIRFEDLDFFVKKSYATTNPGFDEFSTSASLQPVLRGIEGLGIVSAQLGYSDSRQSWFVSRWENLESQGFFPLDHWLGFTPNDYGQIPEENHRTPEAREERRQIRTRGEVKREEIRSKALEAGIDIGDMNVNLFYNPLTGRFFYLDITSRNAGKLNQEQVWDSETQGIRFRYIVEAQK